jgi:hypothetical protein
LFDFLQRSEGDVFDLSLRAHGNLPLSACLEL